MEGNFYNQFGGMGSGNYQFNAPHRLTTNSTHMLVADTQNHRIQIFDLAPTVSITATGVPDGGTHDSGTVSYTVVFSEGVNWI